MEPSGSETISLHKLLSLQATKTATDFAMLYVSVNTMLGNIAVTGAPRSDD